ncbi:MAG: hypothetical protein IJY42_05600, partial [Clostridia bacterium]|nr:hypothetical protein [Clostridia bacterium]
DEPVIGWNRNQWIPNPGCMNLGEHFWPKGDQYCLDLIRRFGQEPSVLFWDVMNEPECTAFLEKTASDYEENLNLTYRFVGHYVKLFAEADLAGAVTVGSCDTSSNLNLERFGILKDLDVISFHDYSADRNGIQAVYDANLALGTRYGKAVVISEMGCPPRGNLYDVAIEIANRNQTGYFLWELMIGKSFWNHIHGVVYPDGTIRDTALVAALYGCFQNRTEDSISYYGNAEGHAALFVGQAEALLANSDAAFEECTAVLERMVHLTEGCQTVPLHCLPTTSFNRLRRTADLAAVKAEMQRHVTLLKQLYSLS